MKKHILPMVVSIAVLLLIGTLEVQAQDLSPGDKVIKTMDDSMTRAKDQYFQYQFVILEPGKPPRELAMDAYIKGTKWRLANFIAPGDVKGTKVLSLSLDQQYVYLPSFRKVRRVASHIRNQSFMGSAYSYDEMATVTYGDLFTGELVSENDKEWVVVGTRRPGKDFSYPKIEFTILKEFTQPSIIKYYSDKGVVLKTEQRLEYSCQGNICNAGLMILTDHTRNDLATKMIRKGWKVNTGVGDDFFSVRELQRGN
jgi:Outer membrane lipoprotein-sorting protein